VRIGWGAATPSVREQDGRNHRIDERAQGVDGGSVTSRRCFATRNIGKATAKSNLRETPMLTRTAIYEGKIKTGHEEEFFSRVRGELEPLWARFPHVTEVRV
jgi:hypothetical protein